MGLTCLKILYVGPDYSGSNATSWRDAFQELGHEVRTVDSARLMPEPQPFLDKARQKLLARPPSRSITRLNEVIARQAREFRPDFTFYIQARCILPATFEETARYGPNFGYFNDDMFNPRNQSFTFFDSIKKFDCILTTNPCNVQESYAVGAPLAIYIPFAFDPKIHYPAIPSPKERVHYEGDVAFIGTFRPERADFLAQLARFNGEFKLNIWGGGWFKLDRPIYWYKWRRWQRLRACIRGKELRCADMGKSIQSNKISLGLLNHANRDQHTYRSFEIPACGGFMLAERTEMHRQFFEEDKEAVYFSSFEELVEKIHYYLAHDAIRQRIAEAGYQRCIRSPYRYVDRATFAIEQFHRLHSTASRRARSCQI